MENKKIILITGASRGIGRALAYGLAQDESNFIIVNYNKSEDRANELKEELISDGKNIEIYKADVSKRNEVKNMIDFITMFVKCVINI